jgi:uncharacterized protein (TIGR02680 family)
MQTPTRFTPSRYFILNVWEYFEKVFEPQDGNLLLRGNNGSGKSKALELLLPLLLEGELDAWKLDPHGTDAKSMLWNLVGDERGSRPGKREGYVAVEFERPTEDGGLEHWTFGIGLRATAGNKRVTPFFFSLPRRRIGHDFELVVGRRPNAYVLTRDQLKEALGEDGRLFERAHEYRAELRRVLFDRPGQPFGEKRHLHMTALLRTLRRPKLSEKLDLSELQELLSQSLPELEDQLVHQVSSVLDNLDQHRRDLEKLEQGQENVERLAPAHAAYARAAVGEHAVGLRAAHREFESGEANRAQLAEELEAAAAELADAEHELQTTKDELQAARSAVAELRNSPEYKSAEALRRQREQFEQTRDVAGAMREDAQRRRRELDGLEAQHGEQATAVEELAEQRAQFSTRLRDGMEGAGVLVPAVELPPESGDATDAAEQALRAAASERRVAVRELRDLLRTLAGAERQRVERAGALDRAAEALRQAIERVAREEERVATARREHRRAVELWMGRLEALEIDSETSDELLAGAEQTGEPEGSVDRELVHSLAATQRRGVVEELARLDSQRETVSSQRAQLEERRAELAGEGDEPPEAPSFRTRENGREGAPLWQLVEFKAGVSAPEQAGVEGALQAAGLLDAWVTPDGRALSADTDDVCLVPDPIAGARTLADVLVAADGELPVERDVVAGILRSVALGEFHDGAITISTAGRAHVGPLRTQYAKAQPEYIGAGARAAHRARLLDNVAADLRAVELEEERLKAHEAALREHDRRLQTDAARFPSEHAREAARALRDVHREEGTRTGADAAHTTADELLDESEGRVREARQTVEQHAAFERLPTEEHALDALDLELQALGELVFEASSVFRTWLTQRAGLQGLSARLERDRAEAAHHDERLAVVAKQLREQEAALAVAEENLGANVEQVLTTLGLTEQRTEALESQEDARQGRVRRLTDRRGKADGRLEEARQSADGERERRDSALGRFWHLADADLFRSGLGEASGVLALTVGDRDLETALSVLAQLPPEEPDADDRDVDALAREVERLYRQLVSENFDPSGTMDVAREDVHGLVSFQATYRGETLFLSELRGRLSTEIDARRRELDEEDAKLYSDWLLSNLTSGLRKQIQESERLVSRLNAHLATCSSSSGVQVELRWRMRQDDQSSLIRKGVRLMSQDVRNLTAEKRATLIDFLRTRVDAARVPTALGDDELSGAERLKRALDYRDWFEFELMENGNRVGNRARVMSSQSHQSGSGGERSITLHMPLLAAVAAVYEAAGPQAPRLIALDEAFAGIDHVGQLKLLGLLQTLDLDLLLNSHDLWGCPSELRGLSIYHLTLVQGRPGVMHTHWLWDGQTKRQVDRPRPVAA